MSGNVLHLFFLLLTATGLLCCSKEVAPPLKPVCGAFTAPGVWKTFQCHNLGTADTEADPFTPDRVINGAYWQWGRSVQAAPGPSEMNPYTSASGWIPFPDVAPDGSWTDSVKTGNDPCPDGYRVPSKAEWDGLIAHNIWSSTGSWKEDHTNYASGMMVGDKLFLPAAGGRNSNNGVLEHRGYSGYYWNSTGGGSIGAWMMSFDCGGPGMAGYDRNYGASVRCVEE
ncbi:MAG: hypothetical protein RLZ62_824 [Bacteroidota bacterium]|jgi:uncharacterized protein (TIGR02145 family)